MKLKKLPKVKHRNLAVLHPIMQKSGVHQKQDIDVARMRERRETKQRLQKSLWEQL